MNKILTLVFVLVIQTISLYGQDKVEKPKYVIILDDKIITKEELFSYDGQLIKSINKGVSQKVRDSLYLEFGEIIKDKELIMLVEIRSEEELAEQNRIAPKNVDENNESEEEFLLTLNDKAANFTVKMLNGKEITLSELKGKVVLLNFWATWCAPCIMELAEIPEKILKPFGGQDFVFIPIAIGQKKETVSQKMPQLKKYGVNFDVGYDTDAEIWHQYAKGSIPKSFLIDKNGTIRYTSKGYAEETFDKLVAEIKKLVSE